MFSPDEHEYSIVQFLQAFGEDGLFLLLFSLPLFLTGFILSYISEWFAKSLVIVVVTLLLFIHIGFTEYFLTVHQLVDSSIYFFSFDELSRTVGLGERFSILTVIALLLVGVIYFFSYRWLAKRPNKVVISQVYFFLFSTCLLWMFFPMYNSGKESAAADLGAESNVSLLFLHSSLTFLNKPEHQGQIHRKDFVKLDPSFTNGKMLKGNYPLFRPLEEKGALEQLLNRTSNGKPPKIVFVIIEGLSSDFVGDKADLTGHMMPFLDSLSEQSVYYPNTLSTSQRTQNVLPSTLCSVPNVDEGTVFQQMAYPDHWSILGLLKQDYSTSFSCGVQLEYMNMRGFMNQHSVGLLSDKWMRSVQVESKKVNSPWGIPDGSLFKQKLADQKGKADQSTLDVLLTISTHDPFVYPEKERFTKVAHSKFNKLKGSRYFRSLNDNAAKFGSYIYLDSEVKKYFNGLKKQKGFENTIFIITGDHGSEMWNRSPLSKYHVPFIIYSPLLKSGFTNKNVVSHLDLTPSLHTYLKNVYQLRLPDEAPYVGRQFLMKDERSKRSFLFTTDQLKNRDVYFQNTILVENALYKVDQNFNLKELKNAKLKTKLIRQRELYKKMSRYVLHQNMLIPPHKYYEFYARLVWKLAEPQKTKVDFDPKHKSVVEIGVISGKQLQSKKIKINVVIDCDMRSGFSADSLPDLVISSAPLAKMVREKTIYRLIRPAKTSSGSTQSKVQFTYELSFDAKQLAKSKKLEKCYIYLYYKMKKSPLVIGAETVISTSNT